MNLNETINSDYKRNELLDDEYGIDDDQIIKEQEEESKYGKQINVSNILQVAKSPR